MRRSHRLQSNFPSVCVTAMSLGKSDFRMPTFNYKRYKTSPPHVKSREEIKNRLEAHSTHLINRPHQTDQPACSTAQF